MLRDAWGLLIVGAGVSLLVVIGGLYGCSEPVLLSVVGAVFGLLAMAMKQVLKEKPKDDRKDPVERVRGLTYQPERWMWDRGWRRK